MDKYIDLPINSAGDTLKFRRWNRTLAATIEKACRKRTKQTLLDTLYACELPPADIAGSLEQLDDTPVSVEEVIRYFISAEGQAMMLEEFLRPHYEDKAKQMVDDIEGGPAIYEPLLLALWPGVVIRPVGTTSPRQEDSGPIIGTDSTDQLCFNRPDGTSPCPVPKEEFPPSPFATFKKQSGDGSTSVAA